MPARPAPDSPRRPAHPPLKDRSETELMLRGYGLTTAEFFYRLPDYRHVLNSFIWQEYDLAPDHPRLFGFIEFWQKNIEGPLHSVRFTHRKLIITPRAGACRRGRAGRRGRRSCRGLRRGRFPRVWSGGR